MWTSPSTHEDKNMIRIYVADLAAYNAGNLRGVWIDLEGMDLNEVQAEIDKMLKKSSGEEWAIHDYEGFDGFKVSEYHDLEELVTLANLDDNDRLKLTILLDDLGYKFSDALDGLEDLIVYGEFDSDEDFAMEWVDGIGGLEEALGERIEYYFDYDSFGRDLRLEGYDTDPDTGEEIEELTEMSDRELGEEYVESIGGVKDLGKDTQENYFDWESFARDLMMDMAERNGIYYDPGSV